MNTLPNILSSKVRAEIFRLLFGFDQRELHVRAIERQAGLALATIRQELKKLVQLDLVQARRDGNRLYYRANELHPLYGEIRNIVLKTSGLVEVLKKALNKESICMAFIFGSIPNGTAKAESDVDTFVIGNIGLREITRMLSGISEKIGREINPYVMTKEEFIKRKQSDEHFLISVLKSPKWFIVGNENELENLGK